MSDTLRDAINAFAEVLRQRVMQDQLARDIVKDNAQPMHKLVAPDTQTKFQVVGAQQVADWKPPGEDVFNAMMDAQDRRDRQDRINEELKRARGG